MKKIFLWRADSPKGPYHLTDFFGMVDDEDYDQINKNRWFVMKLYHCDTPIVYARRYEGKKDDFRAILMHREILMPDKGLKVDHVDGSGLNNQRSNLRVATHSQNMSHRTKRASATSKYLGVFFDGKSYVASCKHNGVTKRMGGFKTEKEAALTYNYYAHFHKGEFAKLNDIYL